MLKYIIAGYDLNETQKLLRKLMKQNYCLTKYAMGLLLPVDALRTDRLFYMIKIGTKEELENLYIPLGEANSIFARTYEDFVLVSNWIDSEHKVYIGEKEGGDENVRKYVHNYWNVSD